MLAIDSVEAVIDWVNERPRPLGLYVFVFADDYDVADRIFEATNSGDACVNDCSIQPLIPELPFVRRRLQIPRPARIRSVHQRPRRALPRPEARPRSRVPPYTTSPWTRRAGAGLSCEINADR